MLVAFVLAAQIHALPDLRIAVTQNDRAVIVEAKRQWERGWEPQWRLLDARFEDIDHFRPGILLIWVGDFLEETRTRTDAFTLEGDFYWAAESVKANGREVARGAVEITPEGIRAYRNLALLGPRTVLRAPSSLDHEIVGYELQVFREGRVSSIYRAKLNFVSDGSGHVTLPPDAKLVLGPVVPELERRRRE